MILSINLKQYSWNVVFNFFKLVVYLILALLLIVVVLGFSTPKLEIPAQVIHKEDLVSQSQIDEYSQIIENTPVETISVETKPIDNFQYIEYGGLVYKDLGNGLYERGETVWKAIKVTTTCYTWMDDGVDHKIGAGDGITSIGKDAIKTYGIAADPKALPYGTEIHVAGYGVYKVDDTGGAMRQNFRKGIIQLDLRIPQLRHDGVWRNLSTIRKIALKHGKQQNKLVLVKIN